MFKREKRYLYIIMILLSFFMVTKWEMIYAEDTLTVESNIDESREYVNVSTLNLIISGRKQFNAGDEFIIKFPENIDISTIVEDSINWDNYLDKVVDPSTNTITYICKELGQEPYPLTLSLFFNTKNEIGEGIIEVFFQSQGQSPVLLEGGKILVRSRVNDYVATGEFKVMLLSGFPYGVPAPYIALLQEKSELYKSNYITSVGDDVFQGIFDFNKNAQHIFAAYVTPQNGIKLEDGTIWLNYRKNPQLTLSSNEPIDIESIVVIRQTASAVLSKVDLSLGDIIPNEDKTVVTIKLPDCNSDVFEYQVIFRTGDTATMTQDNISEVAFEYKDSSAGFPLEVQGGPTTGRFVGKMYNISPWFEGVRETYLVEYSEIENFTDENFIELLLNGVIVKDVEDSADSSYELPQDGIQVNIQSIQKTPGSYEVFYSFTDSGGKIAEAKTTLIIVDFSFNAVKKVVEEIELEDDIEVHTFLFEIVEVKEGIESEPVAYGEVTVSSEQLEGEVIQFYYDMERKNPITKACEWLQIFKQGAIYKIIETSQYGYSVIYTIKEEETSVFTIDFLNEEYKSEVDIHILNIKKLPQKLIIEKEVTGDFGDRTFPFEFSVEFMNMDSSSYIEEIPYIIYGADGNEKEKGIFSGPNKTFMLKHKEKIELTITQEMGVYYKIAETQVPPSYRVTTQQVKFTFPQGLEITQTGNKNIVEGELSNLVPKCIVTYYNDKELVPPTAVNISTSTPFIVMIIISIMSACVYVFNMKRR